MSDCKMHKRSRLGLGRYFSCNVLNCYWYFRYNGCKVLINVVVTCNICNESISSFLLWLSIYLAKMIEIVAI